MKRIAIGLALLASAGCAGYQRAAGISPDNPSTITVPAALPTDSVQARAFAALTRAGFAVSDQRPGIITIGPYALAKDPGVKVLVRVTVISAPGGSDAIVSGVMVEDAFGQAMGRAFAGVQGAAQSQGLTIREATTGRYVRNWQELQRAADVIRAAVPAR